MKKIFLITILVAACCLASGCYAISAPEPAAEREPEPAPPLTLVAAGDNLLHLSLINYCRTAEGYDFLPLYEAVGEYIQSADMAFVNQEGPLGAGAPAGYPRFNAPFAAGEALADIGFTHIGLANNHALDQGLAALLAEAEFWRDMDGVTVLGLALSGEQRFSVSEARGHKFAWLAASYGFSMPAPVGEELPVNLIERETLAADIARAREQAEIVVVSLHWGEEYSLEPAREQRDLAQFLALQGADIIIGHHPHVAQPLEWLEGQDGHRTLVAYSLGNFISAQSSRETMLGGLLSVSFAEEEGQLAIKEAGIIPLVTHYERGPAAFAVYPLAGYTAEQARRHYLNMTGQPLSLDYLHNLCEEIWHGYSLLNK